MSDELIDTQLGDEEQTLAKDDSYVVVARRYRPQTFNELIGQEQVAQALCNAISTNRVGHAYLFTGARGVGKTSAARIFAKSLNCIVGPTPNPCHQCDVCLSISSGSDVDVLEIDGASNRGIDEIRQLRSNVGIRPSRAPFKVYIIDEVHMLTNQAFNALLKTLEEPPEHVKFIFCTTDPEKIPITVLSRCQRFDFLGIQSDSIVERLRQIAAAEDVEIEDGALQLLARRANGSMRDSQSLLEQLLSFGGKNITLDDVHELLGTANDEKILDIGTCLIGRDAANALCQLDAAIAERVDEGQLVQQLLGFFRDMMAVIVGCNEDMLRNVPTSRFQELKETGERFGLETTLAAVQILDQTLVRMRQSTHGRILAEMALIRISKLEDLTDLSSVIADLQAGKSIERTSEGRPSQLKSPALTPNSTNPVAASAVSQKAESLKKKEPVSENLAEAEVQLKRPKISLSSESVDSVWKQVLADLGDMTADYASHCKSVAISAPNRLVVSFEAQYSWCKSNCERPERRTQLEGILSEIIGQSAHIEFVLLKGEASQASEPQTPVSARQQEQETNSHPMVQKATELFDAEVIRVVSGK